MNVKKEILEFIKSNESGGALLLTGKWGCGKTYLLREIADELNDGNEFAVGVVSLFGIQSVEQLNKKVKEKIFSVQCMNKNISELSKKIVPIKNSLAYVSKVLSGSFKIAEGINAALSVNVHDFIIPAAEIQCYFDDTIINKRLVLVFDDLERCKIDPVEMLGAINEYVENLGIKTIILAEEEFITADDNDAAKDYQEFKEKVISRTVRLISDYSNIISAIVNNYKETADGYVSFLKANIDLLIQVFSESEHENLRTFKSFIIDFERIYRVWKDSNIPTEEMPKVLYAFGAIYFESRANNIKKEANVYCFEEKNTADKYSKLSYAYLLSQFEAWIVDGIWDEQSLIDALCVRFSIKNVKDYELFLNCDFWSLNDDIIAKGLPEALALAYEGCLCADDLISLLGRIHSLNNYDVALPCAIDYKRVQDGLKKREESIKNGSIVEPNKRTFLVPDEVVNMCEEARTLYRDIQVFDNRVIALKRRFDFLNYLRCSDSIDIYKLREQRFISFDNELLEFFIASFKTADNRKKKELYYALKSLIFDNTDLSNNDDILDTVNNLNELVKTLTRMLDEEKSSFAGCVIKEIIKDLNERIKKIDVSNKSGT